ncbi:Auxin-responsive GH3 family protein [Hibiscus syriacus]|uniref:Auxin-responsive GH3 family protein n=1 Tax=Hibiscus syriacus TaxID=106335 RepID=A0A6A2ZLP7_HIBSY|nr:Auxin-responsive GH3 family protein [Hibiscus syriacus]
MGVSSSEEKSEKGNHFKPEESISEQANEFRSECLITEFSENKDQCGNAIAQSESAEIAIGVSHSGIDKPSSAEHLGVLSHGVCEHNQETVSPKTHEYSSGFMHKETSDKNPGSEIIENKREEACTLVCDLPAEHSHPVCNDLSNNTASESLGLLPEDSSKNIQTDKLSCTELDSAEPTVSFGSEKICEEFGEPLEQQQQIDSRSLPNGIDSQSLPNGIQKSLPTNVFNQALQLNPEDINKSNCDKHLQSPSEGANDVIHTSNSTLVDPLGLPQDFASENPSILQPKLHCEDISKKSSVEQHEKTPKNSGQRRGGRTSKNVKKNYPPRTLRSSDRVLLSKSQEKSKATESSNSLVDVRSSEQKKRRKRKREGKKEVSDEYSRTRKHLRYLLKRINYERSLIDAYSTEGWKGLSLEKLKPEKELQRATSEILRRKLKIRDLFQHIDLLCAEGRLPESLFDSEGEIDSEDIFCAKCGSKDLPANNDIILCDGDCDRGFHQYCLQPPLLKEDIPPDDEGWLCPGWDDSSSDEYDFTSASEELEAPANVDPFLGLPSEDSEDDNYDPDGPLHDKVAKPESSSSDFTSDSEDLGAILVEDDISSQKDGGPMYNGASRNSKSQKRKLGGKKSINDELLSIMEPASEENGAIVSDKRSIQRLDYKRLYDETYGNVPSSSSDDDDWNGSLAPRKRKKRDAEVASAQPNGNASLTMSVSVSNGLKQKPAEMENTTRRNTRQRSKHKATADKKAAKPVSSGKKAGLSTFSNRKGTAKSPTKSPSKSHAKSPAKSPAKPFAKSPAKSPGGACTPGSSSKQAGSSTYKRLGEVVTQGLNKSFKQNQYPDRSEKESLAKELGITFRQVTKWFENARWCFNNSKTVPGSSPKKVSGNDIPSSDHRKKN